MWGLGACSAWIVLPDSLLGPSSGASIAQGPPEVPPDQFLCELPRLLSGCTWNGGHGTTRGMSEPESRLRCFPLRKYPVIQTDDERERYKAVFQDQFSEYKELAAEVQAIVRKLDELDAVMSRLPHRPSQPQVSPAAADRRRSGHAEMCGKPVLTASRGHQAPWARPRPKGASERTVGEVPALVRFPIR